MTGVPHILREVAEIPERLARAAGDQARACSPILQAPEGRPPRLVVTVGRGSSDYAATCLRYAFETTMGVPAASLSPSLASVYGTRLDLRDTLCLAVSQSGRSPDIRSAMAKARAGGAFTVAIVNDEGSPLALEADVVLPIGAAPERSVAATKSHVGAVAAGLRVLASLTGPDCGVIGWATDRMASQAHGRVLDAARAEGRPVLDLSRIPSDRAEPHDNLRPLTALPTFYRALARTALARGLDPDAPSKLRKVTETV